MNARLSFSVLSDSGSVRRSVSAMRRASSVLDRVLKMDAGAMVRVRSAGKGVSDLFISTPLGCIIAQRVPGTPVTDSEDGGDAGAEGIVVLADNLPRLFHQYEPEDGCLDLGPMINVMWTGALPPSHGYVFIDTVPGEKLRDVYRKMARENREAGAPGGIARSLLEQEILVVKTEDGAKSASITGRTIAAMGGAGIIAKPGNQEMADFDYARVSISASWIRIDALFGTVFFPRPGGLARVPQPT
ncbi:hypothetical protein [Corynebacterium anserum]|uniref:DUF8185 domain-containing protein n=1 Tax=Corynebacterium anserum TaxID=2684406 RepID=A0A7G7YMH4_9CORY|nr:hypothetical protein [Corynebacterium anserum]MBC2681063.1 hypothetical protein [Corynebacterium anserum]QNH95694.1 hypothetical protein GP473_02495 [Corynebacterium anserum]